MLGASGDILGMSGSIWGHPGSIWGNMGVKLANGCRGVTIFMAKRANGCRGVSKNMVSKVPPDPRGKFLGFDVPG